KIMGFQWTHYKAEHLFYLCPKSLKILADRAGFEVSLLKPAYKTVSIQYLKSHFSIYRHSVLTPLVKAAAFVASPFSSLPIRLKMGEMLVILRKTAAEAG